MASVVPNSEATQFKSGSKAVECGRQGGIASGEAKRAKKGMQNIAKWLLEMPLTDGKETAEDIKNFAELEGKNITVEQAILLMQIEKALKGDLQSATFVRDTSGQKPIDKVETTEVPKIIDDVE